MLRSAKSVVGAIRSHSHLSMSLSQPAPAQTITNLKRWSVAGKDIPDISQIKAIHVYDFDNTLFSSPLPNPQLWNGSTIGYLQTWEGFAGGGWWHDQNILCATGEGADIEETRAWKGWWNENVVQLVELSMRQKDALTVLLTGRGEANFTDIIKRIVASRQLEFDLICLKPEVGPNGQQFASTMSFKQSFLQALVSTYSQAEEIRVYEDRVKHVKGFREFFSTLNGKHHHMRDGRKPITAEVIHIAEGTRHLDPVNEVAEVQKLINEHNKRYRDPVRNITQSPYGRLKISRSVFHTGYLINNADSSRLVSKYLQPTLPVGLADNNEVKPLANIILISPRPAPKSILQRAGGIGKKLTWRVTGLGHWDSKLWAARVQPVPEKEPFYTESLVPVIVLGLRKGARPIDSSRIQNWQPVEPVDSLVIDTVVGERAILRVEEDNVNEGDWEGPYNKNSKRRHPHARRDEDITNTARDSYDSNPYQPLHEKSSYGRSHPYGSRSQSDTYRGRGRGGRGSGSARGRGNSSRGGGRGRGRGGSAAGGNASFYRSLDDQHMSSDGPYDSRNGHGSSSGGTQPMNY